MKKELSKKSQGQPSGKSYEADVPGQGKNPHLLERGAGSSFSFARAREEAARLRAEKEVPGALGSKVPVPASGRLNLKNKRKGE